MTLNLDERNPDYYLLKDNHTNDDIGPGVYHPDTVPFTSTHAYPNAFSSQYTAVVRTSGRTRTSFAGNS